MTFRCTQCQRDLSLESFHKRSALKRGHDSWCKDCKSIYRADYFQRNKRKEQDRSRQKAWDYMGISFSNAEYDRLYSNQDGQCGICFYSHERLHVDHNHTTGTVRGLLCSNCNKGIGLLQDSASVIRSAADYLEKHNNE